MFATRAVFAWGFAAGHDHGWLIAIAVGVGIALCVVRMTREKFVPLETGPNPRAGDMIGGHAKAGAGSAIFEV